jgi:hypothetical protein
MSDILTVQQGLGSSWTLQLRDSAGKAYASPPGPYSGSEGLACNVRAGQDQPALFTLSPTWASASAGTITLPIPGSVHATLDVGRYLGCVSLADGSADLIEFFLEVGYSAGTAAALTSYASFQELLDRAPSIEKLQKPTDLAGFARQRWKARQWFEDLLHRHWTDTGCWQGFGVLNGFAYSANTGQVVSHRSGRRSAQLQTWLDDDRLDVTEPVIEAVSCYAIALVYQRSIQGKDTAGYGRMARLFFGRAEDAAANITAEIDSDGDGTNDRVIRLGVADTLQG